MRRVVVESPYAGATAADVEANVSYARRCARDCLARGESPYLSHLLFTQILDDLVPEERSLGIVAGLAWGAAAEHVAVYIDRGISQGMIQGVAAHRRAGRSIACRSLGAKDELSAAEHFCTCKVGPAEDCPWHRDDAAFSLEWWRGDTNMAPSEPDESEPVAPVCARCQKERTP